MTNHELEAKKILKALMLRHDVSYKDLARRLERFDVNLDAKALSTKINRGKFQFAFFLQCLEVLGIAERIDLLLMRRL